MRQIVLDTETTGLDVDQGHRIIEIGCVELVNRRLTGRHYHQYVNPERAVDSGALEVHGLDDEFLSDKPLFSRICDEFLAFVRDAELIIHNAPFDVGFINAELRRLNGEVGEITEVCQVLDTLPLARELHPGRRNTLDALCERYEVDNSQRELHGALLDAEILADVYIAMTSGQTDMQLGGTRRAGAQGSGLNQEEHRPVQANRPRLRVVAPSEEDLELHRRWLKGARQRCGEQVWPGENP